VTTFVFLLYAGQATRRRLPFSLMTGAESAFFPFFFSRCFLFRGKSRFLPPSGRRERPPFFRSCVFRLFFSLLALAKWSTICSLLLLFLFFRHLSSCSGVDVDSAPLSRPGRLEKISSFSVAPPFFLVVDWRFFFSV